MSFLVIFGWVFFSVACISLLIILAYLGFLYTSMKTFPADAIMIWNFNSKMSNGKSTGIQISSVRGSTELSRNRIKINYFPINTKELNPKIESIITKIDNVIEVPAGILSGDYHTRIIYPDSPDELPESLGLITNLITKKLLVDKTKESIADGLMAMNRAIKQQMEDGNLDKSKRIEELYTHIIEVLSEKGVITTPPPPQPSKKT